MEFSKTKFKSDYYKYGPQNLEAQFPHLLKLANLYLDKAKATGIWTDYVKVCGYPSMDDGPEKLTATFREFLRICFTS